MGPPLPLALLAAAATVAAASGSTRSPGSFRVQVRPQQVSVQPGGSVWLNCSTSCPRPDGGEVRTELSRGRTERGPGWLAFQLQDVRAWSSEPRCTFRCAGVTREAVARVYTYQAPRHVLLEPPSPFEDGAKFRLRCHVTRVFPVGFLTVILRAGGRSLFVDHLVDHRRPEPANVTVTHELRARLRDHGLPVTCHARLDLGGQVVGRSSEPVVLRVQGSRKAKLVSWASIGALVTLLLLGCMFLSGRHLAQGPLIPAAAGVRGGEGSARRSRSAEGTDEGGEGAGSRGTDRAGFPDWFRSGSAAPLIGPLSSGE
ncbi:intercellular adhesion molecule 4 [Tachyglossus aculeatus]|uniref:intercellular adhesion molecule 4 n=1 Tax=Tachyglossus aculeatus TaxID=9261 RepID=UPI0018F60F26|nr:intercellular adhesion molecule 4 [Tachyglossus aculeatus]